LDYTNINNTPGQSLRTNAVIELPFGPNRLLAGNSSGWVARAIEGWQLGLIYNLNSGAPTTITAANMLYGNGVPDIVYPVDLNNIKGVRWGIPAGNFLEGRYFDNNDTFLKVADPQCNAVTNLQNLSGLAPATCPDAPLYAPVCRYGSSCGNRRRGGPSVQRRRNSAFSDVAPESGAR
jgi:hypothetical protein